MNRTERRRTYNTLHAQALLAAITRSSDQQQLRERAATLHRHGNSDLQIALELDQSVDIIRRWLSEARR